MFAPSLTTERDLQAEGTTTYNVNVIDEQEASTSLDVAGIIKNLSPLPTAKPRIQTGRKRGKMGIINTTPDIEMKKVEIIEKAKKERERNSLEKLENRLRL